MLSWAALWGMCAAMTATAQLRVAATEPVILRDGAGAALLALRNDGKTALPFKLTDLRVGIFTDETSRAKLDGPKVTFTPEAGTNPQPSANASGQFSIAPGLSLRIVASISGMTGSSAARTTIFYQGAALGGLLAVAVDVPLNVALDGDGTEEKKLDFAYGHSAIITLKNNGKEFQTLDWRFFIGGSEEKSGTVVLTPGGDSRIVFAPTLEVYSWKDYVRPSAQTAYLLLRPHAPEGVPGDLFPVETLPVSLSMTRLGPDTTEFASGGYVLLLLLIGGFLSFLVGTILPNTFKKIDLARQLDVLHDRTSSVSTHVDSYLRVLLRVERKKIEIQLKDVGWFTPSAAAKFDDVKLAINRLDRRLKVTERLDELRREFENTSPSAPPSIMDAIDITLQLAADQLHPYALTDDNEKAANKLLDKAAASLALLDDDNTLAKQIAENFKLVKTRQESFSKPKPNAILEELESKLPGIFEILGKPFGDPKQISRPMFFAIDHSLAAILTAQDYVMVQNSIQTDKSIPESEREKSAMRKLLAREPKLIELLGTLSWKSLRAARNLVQQMRENVYEDDVFEEMQKIRESEEKDKSKRAVYISFDKQKTRPYQPVNFSIAFNDPKYAGSAAFNNLVFHWKFPEELHEEGARVCHYLRLEEPPAELAGRFARICRCLTGPVRRIASWLLGWWCGEGMPCGKGVKKAIFVTVQSPSVVKRAVTIDGEIEVEPPERQKDSHHWVELLSFVVTFGVALAGLEAGAQDQLAKLDFLPATIAIVALGFGADAVKNLLTPTPKKAV
jgi:hypothetical protein